MKKIKILSFVIMLVACLFLPTFVYAAEVDSSTVIEDLKEDPNFNVEDYPDVPTDYSLHVIQLAETKQNELVVYVYQPSDKSIDLLGTKISISYGFSRDGKGLNPKLYDLSLVSSNGVFDKYLIKDFPVPGDSQRYYNIVSIFREFNEVIDIQSESDFDFSDISYSVGQQWYIYDINDSKGYEMATFNTMVIDTIFNGNFEFDNGITWGSFVGAFNYGDCWFIAFNCESYVIQHIYDADMSYTQQKVNESWVPISGSKYEYGEKETKTITLSDSDVMSYKGTGFLAGTYEWNRILSSSEFLTNVADNSVNIPDDVRTKVESSQWVFTYTETERTFNSFSNGTYTQSYYDISDVGILRLHFLDISGKTYDLGVVNSLTDPDNNADGQGTKSMEMLQEFFEKLFAMLGIVVLFLFMMFISNLFPPIKIIIDLIFKAIRYVISLPIKIIKWVFKRK